MYTKITIYTCKCTQRVVYYTRKLQNITKHYKTLQNMEEQEMTYKCLAVDKENGTKTFIEAEYKTKKAFVSELYANGYHPYRGIVEEKSIYDEWLDTTNGTIEELREIKRMGGNK